MNNEALKKITVTAPAKVNLCLSVKYPPVDGYHLLESVFYELPGLRDVLHFEVLGIDDVVDLRGCAATAAGSLVALDCGPIQVPTSDNLVFKAVDALEKSLKKAVVDELSALKITVEKHIPAGGGLGGGSSDAAATIKACLSLMGQTGDDGIFDERILAAARKLGADVAFFLYGGCALMDGRGDTLSCKLPAFPLPIVLMGENQGISTARIYHDFDAAPPSPPDARGLASLLEELAIPGINEVRPLSDAECLQLAEMCSNNLEPAACEALPRLRNRIERAKADPCVLNALVTGSGATSFAICADIGAALSFQGRAATYCDWTCVC